MIRLRPLRPREVRSIRHWAIELAVVVVGVLLALWVAEWAEDRREARADAQAEAAVREELAQNMATLALWTAADRCFTEQALHVRDLLLEGAAQWPGVERMTFFEEPQPTAFPLILRTPNAHFLMDAWQAATASGAVERMPREKRKRFADAYGQMRVFESLKQQADTTVDRLGGLSYPQRLTDEKRSEGLRDIMAFVRGFKNINDRYPTLDFGATPRDVETIKTMLADYRTVLGPDSPGVRDCMEPLRVPQVLLESAE